VALEQLGVFIDRNKIIKGGTMKKQTSDV